MPLSNCASQSQVSRYRDAGCALSASVLSSGGIEDHRGGCQATLRNHPAGAGDGRGSEKYKDITRITVDAALTGTTVPAGWPVRSGEVDLADGAALERPDLVE